MDDLIEALQIFRKYANERRPTNCSHDTLAVCHIDEDVVSEDDAKRLDWLGFFWSDSEGAWISFRFGSC